MTTRIFVKAALLAIPLLALAGCASAPIEMGNIWTDPAYKSGGFQKMLIIGLSHDDGVAQQFERVLAGDLIDAGIKAVPAHTAIKGTGMLDEAAVRQAVKDGGYDSVLLTRVLKVEQGHEWVSGMTYTTPNVYYRDYWGYYRSSYTVVHEPGYMVETTTVTLESNLYDASSEQIVWTAQSRTFNPEDTLANIESLATQVTRNLDRHNLLNNGK